jgi:NADH:ubiquinone oxidoreductase subunit
MAFRQLLNRVSWALFKRETVGFDAIGNKYYRLLDKTVEGDVIERRMVKYYKGNWEPADVPAEWIQWLRKVRQDPPTATEMQAGDVARAAALARAESADAAAAEAAMKYRQKSSESHFTQQLRQPPTK